MRGLTRGENERLAEIAAQSGYIIRSGPGAGRNGSVSDMLVDLMDGDAFLVSLADVPKTIRHHIAAVLGQKADDLDTAAEVAEELRKIAAAIRHATEMGPLQRGE